MSETMLDADGIGLAAPQVHLSHRIFIYRNPEVEDDDKIKDETEYLFSSHTGKPPVTKPAKLPGVFLSLNLSGYQ